jgi:hypothetical protein
MIRYFAKHEPPDAPYSLRRWVMTDDALYEEAWVDDSWQRDDNDFIALLLSMGEGEHFEISAELAESTWPGSVESIAEKATLVSKAVEERMFTLGPLYIPNLKDAHAEWTDPDELQKAVWDYVKKGDRRIRLQHDRDVVAGEWLEIMAWPYDVEAPIMLKDATESKMTFPANTVFLGVQWEPWAWQMIKEGKLRGYSIGGHAQRLLADLPEEHVGKAQASFDDAIRIEADDVQPPPNEGLEQKIAAAVAEAMKSINPVVNVVMPDDKPKVRRVERDENGAILRIVEE